ncbi:MULTISPECIES: hypothetical protein [unclassified Streptomyces]|uniref:hypothetical protein n=1 Tax=unclassified Streptomyces TaxID=2593676 RepID=UPI0004C14A8C|nr:MULTISPECIES: hypothetical protein [unclassified Streptomyces]
MRVWRVGHRSALDSGFPSGPYTAKGLTDAQYGALSGMGWAHSDMQHPCPYADHRLRGIAKEERCGFDSREALNEWFDGWTEAMSEADFLVWEYDVPDWAVRVGGLGQVVFVAEEAVEISHHEFTPEQLTLFA